MTADQICADVLDRIRARTHKEPRRSGGSWLCLCPGHADEKNPSLSVTPMVDGVRVKCFAGCSTEQILSALDMEVKDLFVAHERPGSRQAASDAARPPQRQPLTIDVLARDKRLPAEFLRELGLRENEGSVEIPYYGPGREALPRFRIRSDRTAKRGSRWNRGSGEITPYGVWLLPPDEGELILCEGESDSWTLWHHGFAALGLPGANMTKTLKAEHLAGVARVYVSREPGKGGITFVEGLRDRLQALEFAGEAFVLRFASHKDPNAMHSDLGDDFPSAFRAMMSRAEPIESAIASAELPYDAAHVADAFVADARPPRCEDESTRGRFLMHRDRYYEFTGQCYREVPDGEFRARIARFIRSRRWIGRNNTLIDAVPTQAMAGNTLLNIGAQGVMPSHLQPPVWLSGEQARNLIVLANGVLDIDEFFAACDQGTPSPPSPHSAELFSINVLPYDLTPEAKCERWEASLNRVLPDQALQSILQEWFGYCLLPTNEYQRIMILQGEGANGKTAVTEVLRHLVGPENCSAVPLEQMHTPHATEPMEGKLLNIATEWGHIDSAGVNVLKAISGGGPITINPKHKRGYSVVLPTRMIVATNEAPRISDRSDAIWRRLITIPFNVQIPSAEQRPFEPFVAELCEELPGILMWALRGLYRLRARGCFAESPSATAMKSSIKAESNPTGEWIEDNLTFVAADEHRWTAVTEIYQRYSRDMRAGGYRALNEAHLGREITRWIRREGAPDNLKRRITEPGGTRRINIYDHIALQDQADAGNEHYANL